MHQLVMSSAKGNGCDLGIREEFAPLFDEHDVDLVLCGHDHDYERTHPEHGVDPDSPLLRPQVVADATDVVDATGGAVHMVLGGGGSIPRAEYGQGPQGAQVIVGKGEQFAPAVEFEEPVWSAVTDPGHAFCFAAFDVEPGEAGGTTSISVTHYRTAAAPGRPAEPYDRFRLEKPRKAVTPSAAGRRTDGDSSDSNWAVPAAVGAAAVAAAGAGAVALRKRHDGP